MLKYLLAKQGLVDQQPVQSGLVLHLDSSNPLSYSGTGVSWLDLSASANNYSLYPSTTYDSADKKSLVFNGSNAYAAPSQIYPIGPQVGNCKVTIEAVFKNSNTSNYTILGHNRTSNPHGFIQLIGGTQFTLGVVSTLNSPFTYYFSHSQSLSINTWYHGIISISIPYSATSYSTATCSGNVAINGSVQSFSQSIMCEAQAQNYALDIGRHINYVWGQNYFSGKIGLVRIYNRQLSTAEMTQNYNSCKTRFSI